MQILKALLTFVHVIQLHSQNVTLYTNESKSGTSITLDLKGHHCISSLNAQMDDEISSVDTHGHCLQLYKRKNCCGEAIQVSSAGHFHENLKWWDDRNSDYDNVVSSIGQCDDPCSFWRDPWEHMNVTLYENDFYNGRREIVDLRAGCVNVPSSLKKMISSVENHEACVRFYKGENCLGPSFFLYPNTPARFKNFQYWPGFNDQVSSVSLCDYNCPHVDQMRGWTQSHDDVERKVITVFGHSCFQSSFDHIFVRKGECKNLHSYKSVKLVRSARTYGNCFIAYSSDDCRGDNVTLSDINPSSKGIQNVTFGRAIKSIEMCPEILKSPRTDGKQSDERPTKNGMTDLLIIIGVFILLLIGAIFVFMYFLRKQKRFIQGLTALEIEEFRAGCKQDGDEESGSVQDQVYNNAYNVTFDMSRGSFFIDFRTKLGVGETSRVYKGSLGYNSNSPVAIKTVKRNSDVQYLKALLQEVKVMIYVGKHPHIVELLGCCTEKLHEGEVYIILEYCQNGALDKYLKKNQSAFQDLLEGHENISEDAHQRGLDSRDYFQFNTLQLMRWILQIAEGMNFLAHKNIIHSDLAARNILLDVKNNAKISDFGLSKQLYHYNQYVKKQQVALPWRWLAIESLKNFEFSLESDVWAFGITMWEIFSLGDIPYPGLIWNETFIKMIQDGMRPAKPKYASVKHYNIMLDCWKEVPSERPSFPAIRRKLQNVYAECMKHEHVNNLHMSIYCVAHLPGIAE